MKKKLLLFSALLISFFGFSQVGINTTSPKATLDIKSSNTGAGTAEGLIAPRLTGTQLKEKDAVYLAAQTGAIVYITSSASPATAKTVNVTSAGYYFFDGSIWLKVATPALSGDTTNDSWVNQTGSVVLGSQSNGTSARTPGTEFVALDNGRIGIGTASPTRRLEVIAPGDGTGTVSATSSNLVNFASTATNSSAGVSFAATNATGANVAMAMGVNPSASSAGVFAITNAAGNQFFQFDLGNNSVSVNTQGGNFGINTGTPTSKLQVVGLPVFSSVAAAQSSNTITQGAFYVLDNSNTATNRSIVRIKY